MQNNYSKIISMGIDPGLRKTGWGLIESKNNKIVYLSHGVINTASHKSEGKRLNQISVEIKKIIKKFNPLIVCVENVFVNKNVKSAFKLGMVRGVILQVAASFEINIRELSPRLVKKSITGTGAADKNQVKYIIQKILTKNIFSDDASDALALAVAGSYQIFVSENQINNKLDIAIDKALLKFNNS